MVELTPAEEKLLSELVAVFRSGESVSEHVGSRLGSMVHYGKQDDEGGWERIEYDPGYSEYRQTLVGLCRLGMLEGFPPDRPKRFGDLTSAGIGYFETKEQETRARTAEVEESRRYARKQALLAFLASAALTLLVNARDVYDNVIWLLSKILTG